MNLFQIKKSKTILQLRMEISFQNKRETYDTTIKDIRNLFKLKKENEALKDRIIRNIRNLFEQEDYYKPVRVCSFWSKIILNMKVTVIEIKHYQMKNILIKLEHT